MRHTESTTADVFFKRLYTHVDSRVVQSLLDFRSNNPLKLLVTDDIPWEYLSPSAKVNPPSFFCTEWLALTTSGGSR